MDLALGGACADGSPTDESGDVLRRDHVKEFGAGGHAHLGEIEKEIACQAQSVIDLVGAVEVRIVDETFPADGGAGLLKVDTHDDAQILRELGDGGLQQGGVFARSIDIVDGARADEHEQARVALGEDAGDFEAGIEDGGGGGFRDGAFFFEKNGRKNDRHALNAEIVNYVGHSRLSKGDARRSGEPHPALVLKNLS